MLKFFKAVFIVCFYVVVASVSHAGDSARHCVETRWEDGKYYFTNTCDYNIFVVYCGKTKKFSGKYCGDYSGDLSKGTYYTHSMNLKPGETRYKYKPGRISYGACKGKSGFGKSVRDDSDGSYSCPDPRNLYD